VGKGGRCVRLTTLTPSCAVVMKSGNLNFLELSGPLQACNRTDLPFFTSLSHHHQLLLAGMHIHGFAHARARTHLLTSTYFPTPGFFVGEGWCSLSSVLLSQILWHNLSYPVFNV